MSQDNKFDQFQILHEGPKPLVLYNIWDAGSAKIVEQSGAKAIATGSWSVAAAQGFADGENIPLETVIDTIRTIAGQTRLPVSLDFECGYADTLNALATNAKAVFGTGITGINFEDQRLPEPTSGAELYNISEQCARISCLRRVADEMGLPIFINARTDLFLQSNADTHSRLIPNAIERAKAYVRSGASGIFVPGLTDLKAIAMLCSAVDRPVNVMSSSTGTDLDALSRAGVKRVSHGPHPYRALMAHLQKSAKDIYSQKS